MGMAACRSVEIKRIALDGRIGGLGGSIALWAAVAADPVVPAPQRDQVALFDAARHGPGDMLHATCTWVDDSDLKPGAHVVDKDGKRGLRVVSSGKSGRARSSIRIANEQGDLRRAGQKACGVRLTLDRHVGQFVAAFP